MNNTEFLKGIAHELKFWKGFVQTSRFLTGWVGAEKTPELNQMAYDFITGMCKPSSRVLDVGSGVVSILNGTVSKFNLTAADPLGGLYECIFDYEKYGINPCVPVPAEEMTYENEFDIVHMSNAIDHSQDPFLTFDKLYTAVRPGGFVIIQGFENEGSFEKWEGFHQWDIRVYNGSMFISNKEGIEKTINVSEQKNILCEHFHFKNKTWYLWIIQK